MIITKALLYGAYLFVALLSPVYLLAAQTSESLWYGVAAVAVSSFAGYLLSAYVKRRRALVCMLLVAVICAGILWLVPYAAWNTVLCVLCAAALIYGTQHDYSDLDNRILDAKVMVTGLVLSMIAYLIALLNALPQLQPPIGYTAYFFLMASFILINRKSVRNNAGDQAGRMMRGNQVLVWVFAAVLTFIVFFEKLASGFGELLRNLVKGFFNLFAGGEASGEITSGQAADAPDLGAILGETTQEWPLWVQRLSTILVNVVVAVALIALAAFLCWSIWRALRKFVDWLKVWMSQFNHGGAQEYTEESEQMMSAQSMRDKMVQDMKNRARKLFTRPVHWGSLSARDRVRHIYAQLLRQQKHVPAAHAMTPAQLCTAADRDAAFADLYDRARYSQHEIADDEAEKYRAYLKKG